MNLNLLKRNLFPIVLFVWSILSLANSSYKVYSYSNDNLQYLIDDATRKGKVLRLNSKIEYKISGLLDIKCSIEGNGAKIITKRDKPTSVKVTGNNILLKNLTIIGNDLKSVEITGNHIVLEACTLKNNNYSSLLIISSNSTIIRNSFVENIYKGSQNFAIRNSNKKAVKGLKLINNKIFGGVRLTNEQDLFAGNFEFIGNDFKVDYSSLEQDFKNQYDGIRLGGVENVLFSGNKFYFKNVNRGFKFTDYQIGNLEKKISKRPTTNVLIENNEIISESINGKQLFDMYDGTGIITIQKNVIKAKGHSIIFEDKSTLLQNTKRHLSIIGNKVYYDFRLIYYRGVIGEKVALTVKGNQFFYSDKADNKNLKRIGNKQSLEFDLKYLIFARDLDQFDFYNNLIYNKNYYKEEKQTFYSIKIHRVKNARIIKNDVIGGIIYTYKKGDKLLFEENSIFNNARKSTIYYTTNAEELNPKDIKERNNKRSGSKK